MLYSKHGGEYMAKILIVEDDKRTNMAICLLYTSCSTMTGSALLTMSCFPTTIPF